MEYSCRHDVSMSIYTTSNDNGQMTAWPQGEEYEDRFHYREVPVGRGFLDVRTERISAFYSHAAAYGRCGTVLRGTVCVPSLYSDFPSADRACDPAACESLRPAGAYDSGASYFQHSLLSHFHGASRFAVGAFRRRSLDSRGFECLAGVQRYFATLRGRDENRNR